MTARLTQLEQNRELAGLGVRLADLGHLDGPAIRRRSLAAIRRMRRARWRQVVAERFELGYRDLGGEAGGA